MIIQLQLTWPGGHRRSVINEELDCTEIRASKKVVFYEWNYHQMLFFRHLDIADGRKF
jgi:hypothetical protein